MMISGKWVVRATNKANGQPMYFKGISDFPLFSSLSSATRLYKRECDAKTAIARITDSGFTGDLRAEYIDSVDVPDEDIDSEEIELEELPSGEWRQLERFGDSAILYDGQRFAVCLAQGRFRLYEDGQEAWQFWSRLREEKGRVRIAALISKGGAGNG
ncbi:MAG: hypothetical protein E7478_05185 [Ruminococcaceae bacterium]|nr:hypothetical protein [Oscillospiraceae bacterium]